MKNHFKWMAVLSAAGIVAFTIPAYAKANGWVEENGIWKFCEEGDYYATDSWKKYNDDWYYLDENGEMATEQTIDEYYVDASGKRIYNQWIAVENDDYWNSPDAPEVFWHYYGKDGKEVTSKWLKIKEQWYYFDDLGQMLSGKVEIGDDTFYLGDENDGARKTGWVELASLEDDSELSWYYFEKDGAMVKDQIDKKIGGFYYTFFNGEMQEGWCKIPTTDASSEAASDISLTPKAYQYYDPENGYRVDGWRYMEGIPESRTEDENYWFYFKNGVPYCAEAGIQLFQINSQKYAFNTKGEMQTGLKVVTLDDGSSANFYFHSNGAMETGKQTIYNEALDEDQTWFFQTIGSKKGQGYTGILDRVIYEYGLRKEADDDLRIAPISFHGANYLVNTNGVIQTASSTSKSSSRPELGAGYKDYKDNNGDVFVVDTNGIIQ